jgi:hypothetical protein
VIPEGRGKTRTSGKKSWVERGVGLLAKRNADFVLSPVIKLCCPRRFVVSDLLGHFQLAAVLQIRRDAGRAESMIADARLDAGRFRPPADDAVGVLLGEGIGSKLAGPPETGIKQVGA